MEKVKLIDICDFQGGSQPPKNQWIDEKKEGYIRMLQIRDFTQQNAKIEYVKRTNSIKMCQEDDILIARYGASVGKILTGLSGAYNVAIMKTIPEESKIKKKYLYYYLNSPSFQKRIQNVGSRAAQAGFNKQDLSEIILELPKLEEQDSVIDNLYRVQKVIDKNQEQIKLLQELVKSQFAKMFDNDNYSNYKWKDVFNTTTGKLDSNAMVENGKYPFFTCAKEPFWIDDYAFDCEALLLAGNNAAGIYDVKHYKGMFNAYQRTYVLTLKNSEWKYELFKLQLEGKLELLKYQSKGTNTRYLTMTILNDLVFKVPPIDLQNQFADIVKQIDKQKLIYKKNLEIAQELMSKLMDQYFNKEEKR